MGLGQWLQPEQSMDMELRLALSLDEIAQIIADVDPFKGKHVKERDIEKYLRQVNDYLAEKSLEDPELRKHYITAVSIYVFAKHLLHLETLDGCQDAFAKVVSKSPYDSENPFQLYFNDTLAPGVEEEEIPETSSLVEMDEETVDSGVSFKRSQAFQRKIKEELLRISHRLGKEYSRALHFEFVGFYDICSPLFKIDAHKTQEFERMNHELKDENGAFVLKVPEYFDSQ